jgi:hypothetical protein
MKHFSVFSNSAAPQFAASAAGPSGVSRRSFISFLGIGVASLAVQGCGGGGGESATAILPAPVVAPPSPAVPAVPVPAPVTPVEIPPVAETAPAPVWLPIPPLVFTQGVASSISIVGYVSASNVKAFTLSLNATPLPSGVTFNSATYAFDYDGRGSMATSEGHVLTAAVP